jgi:uncharacterized protein
MPKMSKKGPSRVGRSGTGLGLFATGPIKKGTLIIRYLGPLHDSWKHGDPNGNKYLFEVNSRWTIDGSVRRNIARYINHSCKPNAESKVNQRARTVSIHAIVDIEKDKEITYDYGVEYFDAYLKPMGCKCAACEKKRGRRRVATRKRRRSLSIENSDTRSKTRRRA